MNTRTKLRLLSLAAHVLGLQMTYDLRFIPITGKRADLRGRHVGGPFEDPNEATGFYDNIKLAPKEKTHGTYLLVAKASIDGFYHHAEAAPVADGGPGRVHAGLSDPAQERPAVADAAEAAADDAAGADGAGAFGGRADRPQADAEPGRSVGQVTEELAVPSSLDTLGER